MFGQTFHLGDLGVVAFLVFLEGLLSADNALILAITVRHLPEAKRQKALLYGIGGAFAFRFVAILVASLLIKLWWLQALGAGYLLYMPLKHFLGNGSKEPDLSDAGFWKTVIVVELLDISFAIDSILAGVAVVHGKLDKVWVVYLGAVLGIILLRFAANFFIKLIERAPALDHVAYVLIAWVGVKLLFLAGHNFNLWWDAGHPNSPLPFQVHEMQPLLFWIVMALICIFGGYLAFKKGPSDAAKLPSAEEA